MKDNFDKYLKSEIEKSSYDIPDDGFSERVLNNLPQRNLRIIDRRVIITISTVTSAFVFIIINGLNQFLSGIISLINGLTNFSTINQEFLIVLIIFSGMILSIPFVEIRRHAL